MDTDVPCEFSFNKEEVQNLLASRTQPEDDFAKYEPVWYGVFGWLDPNQGKWLFDMAKSHVLFGDIVEIGSAYGRSTICLGLGARIANVGPVYAIDPHSGDIVVRANLNGDNVEYSSFKGFDRNISRFDLQFWVKSMIMPSNDAFEEWRKSRSTPSIRLLFVDGWHTYDAVFQDIVSWSTFMLDEGVIAVHDYRQEQIMDAVHDSMDVTGFNKLEHVDENMIFLKKG